MDCGDFKEFIKRLQKRVSWDGSQSASSSFCNATDQFIFHTEDGLTVSGNLYFTDPFNGSQQKILVENDSNSQGAFLTVYRLQMCTSREVTV